MDMTRSVEKLKKNTKASDAKESFDEESFKININNANENATNKNPFCIDSLLSKNEVDNYNSDFTEISSEKEFYDICNKDNFISSENNHRYVKVIISLVLNFLIKFLENNFNFPT